MLWWQGWGLVIDPGLGFGEAFRAAGFFPRNINAVIATHHHIDHTGDILPILTCIFEMNDEPTPAGDRHVVDFLFAPGAFSTFADVAAFAPGVRSVRLLRANESAALRLPNESEVTITGVKAEHRDLTGRSDAAIGLRIDLPAANGQVCRVGITGDTRFVKDTAADFKNVDLMVVHIGSIYPYDLGEQERQPWHLGFSGVVSILQEVKRLSLDCWDPMVLVSEWGEELAPDRSVICEEVGKATGLCRVFPAEWRQSVALRPGGASPICAREDDRTASHWHVTDTGYIDYLCSSHDHPSE